MLKAYHKQISLQSSPRWWSRVNDLSGFAAQKLSGLECLWETTNEMDAMATGDQADEIPGSLEGVCGAYLAIYQLTELERYITASSVDPRNSCAQEFWQRKVCCRKVSPEGSVR